MKRTQTIGIFIVLFLCLFIQNFAQANALIPTLTLEAEHAFLKGNHLAIGSEQNDQFVSIQQGNQGDELGFVLDLYDEVPYEFSMRLRGVSSGTLSILDSNGRILMKDNFISTTTSWGWVKVKTALVLKPGQYRFIFSNFSNSLQFDTWKIQSALVRKQKQSNTLIKEDNYRTFSTASTSSAPTLPTAGPWIKQGLNPFTALLQNGNEYVSTTSAILTISATDLVIPGRGGFDLAISRFYNSKASDNDKGAGKYLNLGGWDLGFPSVSTTRVNFPNGSICDLQNFDIIKKTTTLDNNLRRTTYINSNNTYFQLDIYYRDYSVDHYELFLADGTHYSFNQQGNVTLMVQSVNPKNTIQFTYNAGDRLSKITDTLGHSYRFDYETNKVTIVREEDAKTMVIYENGNNLFTVTDVMGRQTRYTYSNGGIEEIVYPSGKVSKYSYYVDQYDEEWYDDFGNVIGHYNYELYWVTSQAIYASASQAPVRKTIFEPSFSNRESRDINYIKVSQYDEDNALVSSTYYYDNQDGLLTRTKTEDKTGKVIRSAFYKYDLHKRKTNEAIYYGDLPEDSYENYSDKLLQKEEWYYDSKGNLVYYKDPEGFETMFTYVNSEYEKTFYRVGAGHGTVSAFYDHSGMTAKTIYTLPSGMLKIRKYLDENKTRFNALETYYQYDANGNLWESKTLSIEADGTKKWIISQYRDYDQYGNCRKQIFDAGSLTPIEVAYEFDPGHSAYMIGKTQRISKNLVADNDKTITLAPPVDAKTSYQYDFKTGLPTKIIDPALNEVTYVYDDLGRPTKIFYPRLATEPVGTPQTYEEVIYDDVNRKVTVYDAKRDNVVVNYFDGLGRLTTVETYSDTAAQNLVSKVVTEYNWLDKPKKIQDAEGKITSYEYDLFGRLTKTITADGNVTTVIYDDLAFKITTIDPQLKQIETILNRNGRKKEESLQNKGTRLIYQYEYDGFGNITKTIDAKNQQMGYVYNDLGQLVQIKYPDILGQVYDVHAPELTVSHFYDGLGNLIKTIDRKNQSIRYQYNEYGQVIQVDLPISTDIHYYYNKLGQLIIVQQPNQFQKGYQYDQRGRLTGETLVVDQGLPTEKSYTTKYNYNQNNAVTDVTYPGAAGTLSYAYNSLDQVSNVKWGATDIVKTINYNKMGMLTQLTYGNQVIGDFSYTYRNGAYLPQNIAYQLNGKQLGVYDYRYDRMGNIVRANNHQFEYDDLGQLIGWKYLKENNKVLLGEQVIWDQQMGQQTGLVLNQTAVSNGALELAIQPNEAIVHVAKLLTAGEVTSSSNVEIHNSQGYYLARNRLNFMESFDDLNQIDTTLTTASVNSTAGTVTLPQTTGTERWISVYDSQPNFVLQKTAALSLPNMHLGEITPNQRFSGSHYGSGRYTEPYIIDQRWVPIQPNLVLSPTTLKDIKKFNVYIKEELINNWVLLGGWGNWTNWVKVSINNKYVGMVSFESLTSYCTTDLKTLPITLDADMFNAPAGLTLSFHYITTKWGDGPTDGGTIQIIGANATEKLVYPINQDVTYSTGNVVLEANHSYKLEATQTIPTGTSVRYELWNSTAKIQDLTNNGVFSVGTKGTYSVRVILRTTNNAITPTVARVKLSREAKYAKLAVVQRKAYSLTQSTRSIALDLDQTLPSGTSVTYAVSNDNGTTWRTAQYNADVRKYLINFTNPGTQVVVKATLNSDSLQKVTPTVNSVKVTAWDTGTYSPSGSVITKGIRVEEPSKSLVLELHGKENGGSFSPSITVNGVVIPGVLTTSTDVITPKPGDPADPDGQGGSVPTPNPLGEAAKDLRTEISQMNLNVQYYKFILPDNLTTGAFSGQLTIKLNPANDRLSSPQVYSYILMYHRLKYYSSGNFETVMGAIPEKGYTFDQVRLTVGGQSVPTGTTMSFQGYLPNSTTPFNMTSGSTISLGAETSSLKLKGAFSTTNLMSTPSLTQLTLTAIGETPVMNHLEAVGDVTASVTGTVRLSSDRVVEHEYTGSTVNNYALLIDHTNVSSASYTLSTQTFDATKLRFVQIWVKPLTDHAISFSTYDVSAKVKKMIKNDVDHDGLFEIGEDLIKDKWNLILLDLQDPASKVVKDAQGLKLEINALGAKVLIDAVSSLPLNEAVYVYDPAGNRERYIENGEITTYVYTLGSNRLDRRYNSNEDYRYAYDANGNLIRQDVTSFGNQYWFEYEFNELNQLVRVKKNGTLIGEYFYDHAGLRYKKVEYDVDKIKTTIYVYGQGAEPIYDEVYTTVGATTTVNKNSYLNLGMKRLARVEGGAISYYFADHLGSTRVVMDAAGKCTYNDYGPFGEDFGTANSERYKFTGKEDDGVTELQYYNARYNDPTLGRFITEDPAKDGLNWYIYCANKPLQYIDPTGKNVHALAGQIAYSDGLLPFGDLFAIGIEIGYWGGYIGGLYRDQIAASLSQTKTETKTTTITSSITNSQKQKETPIYRYGSTTYHSLTPKAKDAKGLSFSLTPPIGEKYSMTTIEEINKTGVLIAFKDGPNHVSVIPVRGDMAEWIASLPTANEKPHPYTVLIKSKVVPMPPILPSK